MTNPAQRRLALEALVEAQGATRATPPLLLPAGPYFDLAGEEFGRRLLLTTATTGDEYCLRPDFTLPIVTDYIANGVGEPAAFSYLGPIFRQRADGPAEFDQAGIELLAQPDGDVALDQVLTFARAALDLFGVSPDIRLGGVGLFEALLVQLDMPDPWRPRIRHRFGHPEALDRLLTRLEAAPDLPRTQQPAREALVADITEQMVAAGLSLSEGRTPDEIADRYLEQQALDAAHVPAATLKLLRDYLAISGPALQALTQHRSPRQDPWPDARRPHPHHSPPPQWPGRSPRQLRRQLLAAPRLLHRHRLRNDRAGRAKSSPPAANMIACSNASAPPPPSPLPAAPSGSTGWKRSSPK